MSFTSSYSSTSISICATAAVVDGSTHKIKHSARFVGTRRHNVAALVHEERGVGEAGGQGVRLGGWHHGILLANTVQTAQRQRTANKGQGGREREERKRGEEGSEQEGR